MAPTSLNKGRGSHWLRGSRCRRRDAASRGVDVGGGNGDDMAAVVGRHEAVAVGQRAAPVWPRCGQSPGSSMAAAAVARW